ncbi:CopL family metal-binding regulatory protein [Luteimonas wenzhouensis]|uniref:CopL family metal-binding regulatory protein n=1 Tax=Luteimonas wenzhouensis TaxID=2599615 RepID=A0A5C5TS62_9GAMM|nr:CopL family metal-binding regulatory protein [Luteimonas wenzhouensis]TWT16854.1 CopL family metal-binding regulatory protein [Luteimonas wenzhouensis]
MPFRALMMRLFLIVALLANGPGIAGASMHMEHVRDSAGDAIHMTTAQTAAESMAACQGGAAAVPVADDHHHPQLIDQVGAVSSLDDCCETGNCCPCMHHCAAALAGSALADFTIRYRQSAEPFLSVHASAALTNLFRPPIG